MSIGSLISRIGVGIFGDTTQLSAAFSRSQSLTSKFADGMKSTLSSAAMTIGAGVAAFAGATAIKEMVMLGAQAERESIRFSRFAGGMDNARVMMDAFRRGTGNAVDDMTAFGVGSKLMQMGLVKTAPDMEKLTEMATRLGTQTLGVKERIEEFSLLLANQSMLRLDNFGISSSRVRARIEELQAATDGLGRDTAFATAVFEIGAESLAKLGERTDDTLTSFERLSAGVKNLQVAIGQELNPVFATLADQMSKALDPSGVNGLGKAFASFVGLLDRGRLVWVGFGSMIGSVVSGIMGELMRMVDGFARFLDWIGSAGGLVDGPMGKKLTPFQDMSKGLQSLIGTPEEFEAIWEDLGESASDAFTAAFSEKTDLEKAFDAAFQGVADRAAAAAENIDFSLPIAEAVKVDVAGFIESAMKEIDAMGGGANQRNQTPGIAALEQGSVAAESMIQQIMRGAQSKEDQIAANTRETASTLRQLLNTVLRNDSANTRIIIE